MRTSEMWLRNTGKKTEYLLRILFGAYIAGLLWITLFSRIGNEYRGFLYPFYSYGEILKGNKRFFFENAGNIVLFIPLGIILKSVGVKSIKRAIMIGLASSLFIEISQTFFSLGVFECDDLMHNTIGTMLGYCFINKVWQDFRINLNRKTIRLIMLSLVICAIIPFGYQEIEHQKMIRLAMLHNRSDGTKNLLVLNGDNGNAWDTNVQIKYLNDGRIHIKASTASKYAGSLQWIEDAGIISRCYNLSATELPLDGNAQDDVFKVYMRDCGLFISMLEDGTQFDVLQGNLARYKGAIFENLIADMFTKMGRKLYYFHKNSGLEVDFVIRYKGECTLVEVKASSGNTKSTKTILAHPEKYHVNSAIKLGDYNVGTSGEILTLPLYMAFLLTEV